VNSTVKNKFRKMDVMGKNIFIIGLGYRYREAVADRLIGNLMQGDQRQDVTNGSNG